MYIPMRSFRPLCFRTTTAIRTAGLQSATAIRYPRQPLALLPRASSRPRAQISPARNLATMSTATAPGGVTATSPAFTQLVVKSMQELFPEELADRSWDNVGLLLDNVHTPSDPPTRPVVLLTNDLTYPVAEEAISLGASVVITYHPIIFRGLKALTCADPQQATLLRLAAARVAVYSPHTALDASPRGINAWLAETVVKSAASPPGSSPAVHSMSRRFLKPISPPVATGGEEGEAAGYGMETVLSGPVPAARIIRGLGRELGGLRHLHVAEPPGVDVATAQVSSVAVCAGSGADVLRGSAADMWVTGEMSHHDALGAAQRGKIVVTTYHSNTERTFLETRLRGMLEERLRAVEGGAEVVVSKVDRDPFRVVDLETL